jgi:hypothetical protein
MLQATPPMMEKTPAASVPKMETHLISEGIAFQPETWLVFVWFAANFITEFERMFT